MSKQAVSFDELAELVRKLDKACADGTAHGRLRVRGDFQKIAEKTIGVAGRASMSDEIAALMKLVPAALNVSVERVAQWVATHDFDLEVEFGKPLQP